MTDKQLQALDREWKERLRASNFHDIEAPSKMVPRPKRVTPARLAKVAQLEREREATDRLRFAAPWERQAWELHLEGMSARKIARKLCLYRKLVDEAFTRLRWQMERKPRGRRRDPESLRSHGMRMELLLTPAAALALDHLRAVLKASKSEVVRRVIVELAQKTPAPSLASGAIPPCSRMGKAA